MNKKLCVVVTCVTCSFPICYTPRVSAAVTGQWDFNGTLASSTEGSDLIAAAAFPATFAGVSFTNLVIDGQSAHVAAFTRGTYFRMTHGLGVNGGGALLNRYTLIMDVMFPNRPTGWAALWQTSPGNNNDADWFINPNRGVGISGNYAGTVIDGSWHRLALVVDSVPGTLTSFINGMQVQQLSGLTPNGRWALETVALLFADENQENAAGFVNGVQLRSEAMPFEDIAALAGPSAAGIPIPQPPTLRVVTPNGGESLQAGSTQTVAWVATNAGGLVQISLHRGDRLFRNLAQVPMLRGNYQWVIYPRLGDSNNYRVKITSITFPAASDLSDGAFSIFGSRPPPNPVFGQPLENNGGFEQQLAEWEAITGQPTTLTATSGKGAPVSGTRFYHGGLAPAGDSVVRQEIDLLAAGFTASDIDNGAALDAEARLRNWFGAGIFDDQVYYRVAYLNGEAEEISSIRCMVAANNVWLPRQLSALVPPGTRRLRLDVVGKHRRDRDNDSMADDIIVRLQEALIQVTPRITKLPMLQDVRPDAMTLLWETDGNLALHAVEWGRSDVTENTLRQIETLQIDATHFVHRATMAGLETETLYVYRVRSGATNTPTFSFRTAPKKDTPFAVAWWGDNHEGTVTLRTHVSNMLAHAPDLIAVAGDMVNSGASLTEWHDYWFKPLEHLHCAQTTPVIFARGNHDGEHALAYAYSALPGNESWFAFDYGNSRFIFLDSEVSTGASPEQFAWLQAELARPETQRAAFRIVCFHRPPWVNLWNGGGYLGETFVRNDWSPLFAQRNVDIVICGHAHNYNRGETNGVVYVISGGGGGVLDVERVANWPLFTVEYSRYHWDLMEANGDSLTWQVFDHNNQLIDMFALKSRTPELVWKNLVPSGTTIPLVLSGRPGASYILEVSTNLTQWSRWKTNTISTAGLGLVTNAITLDGNQRFFRARSR